MPYWYYWEKFYEDNPHLKKIDENNPENKEKNIGDIIVELKYVISSLFFIITIGFNICSPHNASASFIANTMNMGHALKKI